MNKSELIKAIAEKSGLTQTDTEQAVNAFLEIVPAELKKKGKVTLVGFGTFGVATRKARKGVNPKTGAKINIPARTAPVFKAGKALKDKVAK